MEKYIGFNSGSNTQQLSNRGYHSDEER